MAEQILEGVSPTRMDLLEIQKKLVLAEKGHKLLEEKRDALVEKFFDIIDKRNKLSTELDVDFKEAFKSLTQASHSHPTGAKRLRKSGDFFFVVWRCY